MSGQKEAAADLLALHLKTRDVDRENWDIAEQDAQQRRRDDIEAMDIYDSAMSLRMSIAWIEIRLLTISQYSTWKVRFSVGD